MSTSRKIYTLCTLHASRNTKCHYVWSSQRNSSFVPWRTKQTVPSCTPFQGWGWSPGSGMPSCPCQELWQSHLRCGLERSYLGGRDKSGIWQCSRDGGGGTLPSFSSLIVKYQSTSILEDTCGPYWTNWECASPKMHVNTSDRINGTPCAAANLQ